MPTVYGSIAEVLQKGAKIFQEKADRLTTIRVNQEEIARICHQVNKAYCQALGDNSQLDWGDAPQWQKDSAMLGVQLHIDNPEAGAEASHVSWMNQKIKDGWVYGPVKDEIKKEHPCLVPFKDLPPDQQAKDYIFRQIVKSALYMQGVRI